MLTSVHPALDVRIFQKQCKSLVRAGYEVSLIACHDREEVIGGVKIKALRRAQRPLSRFTGTVWRVYREARRQDAHIYQFHDLELIPVGLLLRLQGKKVVYDVHENVPHDIVHKYYLAPYLRRPLAWIAERLEAAVSPWLSGIVAATPTIADRFRSRNNTVFVIQNFPRTEEFSPDGLPWAQRGPDIAYIGAISEDRGIREMIQVMSALPDSLGAKLKLAGAFTPSSLRQEVAALSGWSRVDFLGMLDRPGLSYLLSRVRAGLLLLHPEQNYIDSLPTKLFEYMSAGIPVVASDFPMIRDIVLSARCGVLVDPKKVRGLARAIEYLLSNPAESEAMGQRGREAVELRYNWSIEERKLLCLYGQLSEQVCAG